MASQDQSLPAVPISSPHPSVRQPSENQIQSKPPDQGPLAHPLPSYFSPSATILIAQGAEALLYKTTYLLPTRPALLKLRPPKAYRHPTLDQRLTKHRILAEARLLVRARRDGMGSGVPGVLFVEAEGRDGIRPVEQKRNSGDTNADRKEKLGGESTELTEVKKVGRKAGVGGWMLLEWIEGPTVREALFRAQKKSEGLTQDLEERSKGLLGRMGQVVSRLHGIGIVHGDLTTSNIMLRVESWDELLTDQPSHASNDAKEQTVNGTQSNDVSDALAGEIVIIDFGLGSVSVQDEDRAVDLYVLERAFASTHPKLEHLFEVFIEAYGAGYKGAQRTLKRLDDVRLRGRKRSMLG